MGIYLPKVHQWLPWQLPTHHGIIKENTHQRAFAYVLQGLRRDVDQQRECSYFQLVFWYNFELFCNVCVMMSFDHCMRNEFWLTCIMMLLLLTTKRCCGILEFWTNIHPKGLLNSFFFITEESVFDSGEEHHLPKLLQFNHKVVTVCGRKHVHSTYAKHGSRNHNERAAQ